MYNFQYTYNTQAATGFFAALGALVLVFIVFGLAIAAIMIVAEWKIFTKGKQPGWAALIPIYNQYILCKMVGVNPWWILIVFCAGILGIIPVIGTLASFVASIYFLILVSVSLARAFGKEDSFAIGLILLPIVFYPILAFGKDEFKGANPMNDIIFKDATSTDNVVADKVKEATSTSSKKSTGKANFCSNCGKKVTANTKFCPNCGKEV